MALTFGTGLTNLTNAEAADTLVGFRHDGGGSPAVQEEADNFIQGSQGKSIKTTSAGTRDEGIWWDDGAGIDFTTGNLHLYIWYALTTAKATNTRALGGIYIIVGSSTTNWNKYYVGGSDVSGSGFVRYVLDPNKTPSETSGTPATLSSLQWFGMGVKSDAMTSRGENQILDRMDYGKAAIQVIGDDTLVASYRDLLDEDQGNDSNRYGLIERQENGTIVLRGGLTFGSTSQTTSTDFTDATGEILQFSNPTYYNGTAVVSSIDAPNLYIIQGVGGAGAGDETSVTLGTVIGAGDDRQGIGGGTIGTAGPAFTMDFETDIADLAAVNLYGVSVRGAGITAFSGASITDIIGCSFTECDEVQPNDSEFLNNTIIAPRPQRGLEVVSGSTAKQTNFIAADTTIARPLDRVWQVDVSATPDLFVSMTAEAEDAATGDVVFFPASEAAGDYCAFGSRWKFGRLRIDVGTGRGSGTLLWEYWNGSSWTLFDVEDGFEDNTLTLENTTFNNVNLPHPMHKDWAKTSLNGEDPLYYLRLRVTVAMVTNPIGDQLEVNRISEHMVHLPAAGTFTGEAWNFFGTAVGRKHDIENSANAASVATAVVDNANQDVGSTTVIGVAQSFVGDGTTLCNVRWLLGKTSGASQIVTCNVYASDGGSPPIPTGAILATSNTFDASDLAPTDDLNTNFEFEDEFTLVNLTDYFVALEVDTPHASNFPQARVDTAGGFGGGSFATQASGGAWTGVSGTDAHFTVNSDAVITISATELSNPASDQMTGIGKGAVIIDNAVTLTVNVKDQDGVAVANARVAIFDSSDVQLMNELTTTGGVATEPYGYAGDEAITVRVRRSLPLVSGTATAAHAGTQLTDSAAFFLSDGLQPGDIITNVTDGSTATITTVDLDTQITHSALAGGSENDWDSGEVYSIGGVRYFPDDSTGTIKSGGFSVDRTLTLDTIASA